VALLCQVILEHRPHSEQGFRTTMGIVRLAKVYGVARLEAACERALLVSARSYGAVKSILDNRLDGQPVRRRDGEAGGAVAHPNIRGSTYYR